MNIKTRHRFFAYFLFLSILLSPFLSASHFLVHAEEKQVIRVAYPTQQSFTEFDEYGQRQGYTYDYLVEIAKYNNWKYEFVDLEGSLNDQLSTALDMLERGEVDLMGAMTYSPLLAETYDYSTYNYGTSYWVLASLSSNTALTSDNFYLKQPLRVAVGVQGGIANNTLDSFASVSGFEIEQIYCKSGAGQIEMLREGKADALLAKSVSLPNQNLNVLTSFFPQPFYFATTKDNQEIISELDNALLSISQNSPEFTTRLQNKYFVPTYTKYVLSDFEKEYIAQRDPLKVAVLGGKAPIQYIDSDTGEYRGVSMDVLDYISDFTGLQFDVHMTENFEEYSRMVENKEVDLCLGVVNSMHQYDWQNMWVSNPYLETHLSFVLTSQTSPSDLQGKTQALPFGTAYSGTYNGDVLYYETAQECLDAVQQGNADYFYIINYPIQYYTASAKYSNLIVIPQNGEWGQRYSIGVLDSTDYTLMGLLNKSVNQLVREDLIKNFLYDNAYQLKTVTLRDFLVSNPLEAGMTLSVVFLTFLSVILIINIWRGRARQQLKKLENQRYEQICEISNEYLFEFNVKEGLLSLSDKCAEFLELPAHINQADFENYMQLNFLPLFLNCETPYMDIALTMPDGHQTMVRITTKQLMGRHGEVLYLMGKMQDVQKEFEEKAILQERAEKDTLTDLYNIATFREKAQQIYGIYPDHKLAFFILDIDYFKQVNDTFGHFIGDRILEALGDILKSVFHEDSDIVARLGGDEFVALALYTNQPESLSAMCLELQSRATQIHFPEMIQPITISIGVAIIDASTSFDDAYKLADKALYHAKESGRNNYHII